MPTPGHPVEEARDATNTSPGPPFLTLLNLSKKFAGPDPVVDDVSLSVGQGEFVSILGPSGCGKSTLLGMVAGLLTPTSGVVTVAGRVVRSPPPEIVYIFQQYSRSLFPWLTVAQNVAFGARRRDRSRRQPARGSVEEHLVSVGLEGYGSHYPSQLSGGQQQRVAIARGLAAEPQVLLMDEPFSALDSLTRGSLQDLLRKISGEMGLTVLFVTHDVEEAIYLSTRVAVLSKSPSRIVDTLPINLPVERDQVGTKESRDFLDYRRHLYAEVIGAH
jgi:NitT/TauT family transport system ATP-binding protein